MKQLKEFPGSWSLPEEMHRYSVEGCDEELTLSQVPQNEHAILTDKGQGGGEATDLRHYNGRSTGPHVLAI